jgi:copper oxidase (laccase) domain-containing protein
MSGIAGLAIGLLQQSKANQDQEKQAKLAEAEAQRNTVLDKRAMRQQLASSIGLQGMDTDRQAAYQRQQQFFDYVMNKYRIGGGVQNG